jgi:serine/threonine protein kinase
MRSTVGTSYYVAPEVLRKRPYTNKCDMWSLGVVLFMLLSGKSPFLADSEAEILNAAIKAGAF